MKLQKQVLYAIDSVAMITETQAKKFDAVILTSDIAETLGISKEFARNLLSTLVRNDVLVSVRGPSGGYRLAREPEKTTIAMIVEALAPQEMASLNENGLNTQTHLGQEVCEALQDQTVSLFSQSITDFVRASKAGVQGRTK